MKEMASWILQCALAVIIVGMSFAESPNGVHLAFTEVKGSVRAMWSLPSTPVSSSLSGTCQFGTSHDALTETTAPGPSYTYADGGFQGCLFDVVMENLKDDTIYFYKCGSDASGFSNVFNFRTMPASSNSNVKIVVWGDMGINYFLCFLPCRCR
jgi:hypothetical protein